MENNMPKYLPGFEPEEIADLLKSFFQQIDKSFPDMVIVWSEWNHTELDETAKYFCRYLGYDDLKDFLQAYGYKIFLSKPHNAFSTENAVKKRFDSDTAQDTLEAIIQEVNQGFPKEPDKEPDKVAVEESVKNEDANQTASISFGGIVKLILFIIVFIAILSSLFDNSYEKTAKNAYDKFTTGDFDSMTDEEEAYMDSFLNYINDKSMN